MRQLARDAHAEASHRRTDAVSAARSDRLPAEEALDRSRVNARLRGDQPDQVRGKQNHDASMSRPSCRGKDL